MDSAPRPAKALFIRCSQPCSVDLVAMQASLGPTHHGCEVTAATLVVADYMLQDGFGGFCHGSGCWVGAAGAKLC